MKLHVFRNFSVIDKTGIPKDHKEFFIKGNGQKLKPIKRPSEFNEMTDIKNFLFFPEVIISKNLTLVSLHNFEYIESYSPNKIGGGVVSPDKYGELSDDDKSQYHPSFKTASKSDEYQLKVVRHSGNLLSAENFEDYLSSCQESTSYALGVIITDDYNQRCKSGRKPSRNLTYDIRVQLGEYYFNVSTSTMLSLIADEINHSGHSSRIHAVDLTGYPSSSIKLEFLIDGEIIGIAVINETPLKRDLYNRSLGVEVDLSMTTNDPQEVVKEAKDIAQEIIDTYVLPYKERG